MADNIISPFYRVFQKMIKSTVPPQTNTKEKTKNKVEEKI